MATTVGIIGNCQAQAMEALSRHIGAPFEVVGFRPVWLYRAEDEDQVLSRARRCDLLFQQRVSDDYEVPFLRTSVLKREFADKLVSWPNIYFDGYFPTICYYYTHSGKLTGPLSDYHFPLIRDGWAAGRPVAETLDALLAPSSQLFADDPVAESLHQLRSREEGLDVIVSDLIEDRFRHRKLLYTPNHPADELILATLSRLVAAVGLALPDPVKLDSYRFTLDNIQVPILPAFHRRYGGSLPTTDGLMGRTVSFEPGRIGETDHRTAYDWPTAVETYYRIYDAYADAGWITRPHASV